jgi:NADPH-dependent 2,4-dienoyl-CoA reductase/sulfur reductase-like enzyme
VVGRKPCASVPSPPAEGETVGLSPEAGTEFEPERLVAATFARETCPPEPTQDVPTFPPGLP